MPKIIISDEHRELLQNIPQIVPHIARFSRKYCVNLNQKIVLTVQAISDKHFTIITRLGENEDDDYFIYVIH